MGSGAYVRQTFSPNGTIRRIQHRKDLVRAIMEVEMTDTCHRFQKVWEVERTLGSDFPFVVRKPYNHGWTMPILLCTNFLKATSGHFCWLSAVGSEIPIQSELQAFASNPPASLPRMVERNSISTFVTYSSLQIQASRKLIRANKTATHDADIDCWRPYGFPLSDSRPSG